MYPWGAGVAPFMLTKITNGIEALFITTVQTFAMNAWYLVSMGSDRSVEVNGVACTNTGGVSGMTPSAGSVGLGYQDSHASCMPGMLGEIILYNSLLAAPDRAAATAALLARYGL
jgi:hypothetical protein